MHRLLPSLNIFAVGVDLGSHLPKSTVVKWGLFCLVWFGLEIRRGLEIRILKLLLFLLYIILLRLRTELSGGLFRIQPKLGRCIFVCRCHWFLNTTWNKHEARGLLARYGGYARATGSNVFCSNHGHSGKGRMFCATLRVVVKSSWPVAFSIICSCFCCSISFRRNGVSGSCALLLVQQHVANTHRVCHEPLLRSLLQRNHQRNQHFDLTTFQPTVRDANCAAHNHLRGENGPAVLEPLLVLSSLSIELL